MRFIHMADAHLGMEPDKGMAWSKERKAELWQSFERIIGLCVEEKIDLLLIAGDLFHRQPTIADVKEMRYLLGKLGKTRVVLLAGNHDYLSERSRLHEMLLGDRIMLLPAGEVSSLLIPSCNTTVYGISYSSRKEVSNPFAGIRPYRTRGHHILLAHGGDAEHMPFDRAELAQAGFDYVALGHIHKQELLSERMAYCGSPEPLDRTETGRHGVILGELTEAGCHLEFLALAARAYRELTLAVSQEDTLYGLRDRIAAQVEKLGSGDIYRIILDGWREPQQALEAEQLKELLAEKVRIIELTDRTKPYFDFEYLYRSNQGNLLGGFIEAVWAQDADEEWKRKVLAIGVEALQRFE